MSKASFPHYRRSAVWIAAIALIAIAAAGCAVKCSGFGVQGRRASNSASNPSPMPAPNSEQRGQIRASLDALPLAFEANQGQTDPQVKYTARGSGYSVFLTANDAVFAIRSSKHSAVERSPTLSAPRPTTEKQNAAIEMRLVGGNSKPEIIAGHELPGIVNYYVGTDPKNWHAGVKQYSSVSYRQVYPGVNMVFHGAQRQLEFDFVVNPGADPNAIALAFQGVRQPATDAWGNLVLASPAGDVILHKPLAYQEKDGQRQIVEAAFQVRNTSQVALNVGAYDRGRELVIDPTLSYSTYLGGSAEDDALAVAVDNAGNAYVTGQTKSPTFGGVHNPGTNFAVFVTEVNAMGTAIVYTDIFAATGTGSGDCSGNAIAVDSSGNAYVAGSATVGFPIVSTLQGVFQGTFAGGTLDAFVLKLDPTGAAPFSTYLGGNGKDIANGIAVDGSGNIYVAGDTFSTNFPTATPIQASNKGFDDAFVAKLDSTGSTLLYSTYLGGSSSDLATGIALDGSGNAYITGITISTDFPTTSSVFQKTAGGGDDSFVAEVKSDGSALVYSTYLGGSGTDDSLGIAVDSSGDAYVTGGTSSTDFPTANAAQSSLGGVANIFVTKLSPGATTLLFSTYYGGAMVDTATGIALDKFADAYVTGEVTSPTYPVLNSFQATLSGPADAFVTEFSNTGFVVYSSFYGGTGNENSLPSSSAPLGGIAVDGKANAYIVGNTKSTDLHIVGGVQPTYAGDPADGFVAKLDAAPADFSVAVSPNSISTTSGQTTSTITITVSSVNSSFGSAVNLSCGGLPSKALCQFSPASVTPGSGAQTSNLTIATNGASSASLERPTANRGTRLLAAAFLPMLGIALLATRIPSGGKKRLGFLLLVTVLAGLMILPACSGSNGGGAGPGGGGGGTSGTPSGAYEITVTGTAGSANHSAPLALTVN